MPTDPSLPGRLDWAAGQVGAILGDEAWRPFVSSFATADAIMNINFVIGVNPPDMWVGDAYDAHVQDLGQAADSVRTARQRLEALRDQLKSQSLAARSRLETEAAEARAGAPGENPFGSSPFGSYPYTY